MVLLLVLVLYSFKIRKVRREHLAITRELFFLRNEADRLYLRDRLRPASLLNHDVSFYRLTSRSILMEFTPFSYSRFMRDDFYFNRLWDRLDAPDELISMIRFRHRYGTLSFKKVTQKKIYSTGTSDVELLPTGFVWGDR